MPEYSTIEPPESERLLASRAKDAPYRLEPHRCAVNPEHRDDRRVTDLSIEVKHNKRDELIIWSWTAPPVIHASLVHQFELQGISGYRLKPASVRFRDGEQSTEYSELMITGWAGVARPESGIQLTHACPGCLIKKYTSLVDSEQVIDWNHWTGEDFFIVWPLPNFRLITKRVADLLNSLNVKSYQLGRLRRLEQRFIPAGMSALSGFTVGRLSRVLPEDMAVKYGRPLGLE